MGFPERGALHLLSENSHLFVKAEIPMSLTLLPIVHLLRLD